MNQLKRLREALGITQTELAGLLGVNRGRVAMAEIGKRHLPSEARSFVAWMLDELDTWPDAFESELPDATVLQKEIRRLEIRLENLRIEFEKYELKEGKAGFLTFICNNFESRFPAQIPLLAKQHVTLLQAIENLRKDKNSGSAPVFLKAKIKGLECRIVTLKALL